MTCRPLYRHYDGSSPVGGEGDHFAATRCLLMPPLRQFGNAMSGRKGTLFDRFRTDLTTHNRNLDVGCRKHTVRGHPLTAVMFRAAKFLFQIAVLAFTVWLVEFVGVGWEVAVSLAVLFISGPEGLEAWLVRQGVLDGHSTNSDDS